MGQRIVQVDAFTDTPFAGNPAAVCVLERERDAVWMQQVAREMNLAETAFLVPASASLPGSVSNENNDYNLRWFTPQVEVDLCGHATLASAHVLWEEGHLPATAMARFHTRSGLLTAERRNDLIELDFPAEPPLPAAAPPGLIEGLGLMPQFVGKNRMDYLVEVAGETELRALRPDFGLLGRIPVRGIIVTSRSEDPRYNFVSRFFAPAVGVDEDPVTGSSHCCLGPYWQRKQNKTEFTAYQASARGGVVRVRIEGERVKLGGQTVTVLRGELTAAATGI